MCPGPTSSATWTSATRRSPAATPCRAGSRFTATMPEWLHLNKDAQSFTSELKENAPGDPSWEALKLARERGLAVVPLINNYQNDTWQGGWLDALLQDPDHRARLIGQIKQYLLHHH